MFVDRLIYTCVHFKPFGYSVCSDLFAFCNQHVFVFEQGNKKRLIPDPKQASKMRHFYNCLACIMTYNLQTLCLKSMQEFTNYIKDVGVRIFFLIINLF